MSTELGGHGPFSTAVLDAVHTAAINLALRGNAPTDRTDREWTEELDKLTREVGDAAGRGDTGGLARALLALAGQSLLFLDQVVQATDRPAGAVSLNNLARTVRHDGAGWTGWPTR